MIRAGIIGSTGYAGGELVRILLGHKDVEIKWYGSRSYIDKKYASVYQNMFQLVDDVCKDDNMEQLAKEVDVIFTATPQGLCINGFNLFVSHIFFQGCICRYENAAVHRNKMRGEVQGDRVVLDKDVCPQTKWVEGSNYVDVNLKIDPRTKRIIMMGAMDNLVKGAAGQAVQNMNLMFGLPENEGLCMPPMFP